MVEKKLGCTDPDFELDLKSGNHLKSGQIDPILLEHIQNPDKNVCILNGPVFGWLQP